jgi:integrase
MGVKVRERPPGSGIWWIYIDHQGKRKAKKIGKEKRLAVEAAKKIEAKLTLGDLGIADNKTRVPSFREYAETWLHGYVKGLRRQSTFCGVTSIQLWEAGPLTTSSGGKFGNCS